MFAYLKTKKGFVEEMTKLGKFKFADKIMDAVTDSSGDIPSIEECRSWQNSLEAVADVLRDNDIPENSGVGIEYKFPTMPYRIDFMISGFGDEDKADVIIIELKQWAVDGVKSVQGQDKIVKARVEGEWKFVSHPSYQAFSYAYMISQTNKASEDDGIEFFPCAYLHNYVHSQSDPKSVFADQYEKLIKESPVFVKGKEENLQKFIKDHIKKGDDAKMLKAIENGKIKSSKSLGESFLNVIKGNQEFQLMDDQMVVYEEIVHCIDKSIKENKKRAVIVQGGPGTGKSVLAINLLAKYYNEGVECVYTSKNNSPRNYYINKIHETETVSDQRLISGKFRWSGSIARDGMNVVNVFKVILADESHRLVMEKPSNYSSFSVDEIEGIINAGLCSVFFIDEGQHVSLEDYGTIENIKAIAKNKGAKIITTDKLVSQFRCGGSSGYLDWLDSTLQIKEDDSNENEKTDLKGVDYDFRVFDSPQALWESICERNDNGGTVGSRVVAGYCWEWPYSHRNDPDYHDIKDIPGYEDFEMSWNLENRAPQKNSGNKGGKYTPKYSYAYDEDSINQVGCIHTVQGLDFDYVGVIIGNDMRYEDGKIVTDRTERASTDVTLRGIEDTEDPDKVADEIIKNTYRVLMSRGMKGCYVFCVDDGLKEYLIERSKKE